MVDLIASATYEGVES